MPRTTGSRADSTAGLESSAFRISTRSRTADPTGRTVSTAAALVTQLLVVVALGTAVGLQAAGWAVTLGCVTVLDAAVAVGLRHFAAPGPRPGDQVTLARAVLACLVAGLTAEALLLHRPVAAPLVPIAAVALVMDAVDGWVARHTRTTSRFGQRFDGEVDAFLILVLSAYVVPVVGVWVLAAGLLRYVFGAAGWVRPWFRAQLPYRYWRKVVTATVGIVLTATAAEVLPRPLALTLVLLAMGLLAESFARDVWWLWRRRADAASTGHTGAIVTPSPELV